MKTLVSSVDDITLFCRLIINTKRKLPVRASEMGLLIYICTTDGEKTPLGVSRFFKVTKAMATNLVTSLIKKGFLVKTPAENDRRSAHLCPTKAAKLLVENTYQEYCSTIFILQSKLGEEDFQSFMSLINRANAILLEERDNG